MEVCVCFWGPACFYNITFDTEMDGGSSWAECKIVDLIFA